MISVFLAWRPSGRIRAAMMRCGYRQEHRTHTHSRQAILPRSIARLAIVRRSVSLSQTPGLPMPMFRRPSGEWVCFITPWILKPGPMPIAIARCHPRPAAFALMVGITVRTSNSTSKPLMRNKPTMQTIRSAIRLIIIWSMSKPSLPVSRPVCDMRSWEPGARRHSKRLWRHCTSSRAKPTCS